MIFETDRLRVRKLNLSDFDAFHRMQSNIEVMQYITGEITSPEESLEKLKEFIGRYKTKKKEWPFAVEMNNNATFVGLCGIIEENEIGYRFLPEFWRKGFGAEILEGLINYAKKLELKNLIADVIIENEGSLKLLKRAGFIVKKEQICPYTGKPEYVMELKI